MSLAAPIDESVDLAGIALRNPVLTASGTFGYGTEFAPFLDLEQIGGFVAKSLTLEPRSGNPPPRIAETPAGMLNAISIENVGVRGGDPQCLERGDPVGEPRGQVGNQRRPPPRRETRPALRQAGIRRRSHRPRAHSVPGKSP